MPSAARTAANVNELPKPFQATRAKNVRVEVNGGRLAALHDELAELVNMLKGPEAMKAELIRRDLAALML